MHSAITLLFNGIEEQKHGPSHWKFNSNLTKDEEYIKLITDSVPVWIEEFKDVNDKSVLWDLIKHRIRQVSTRYSKEKARLRRVKVLEIETSLTFYQEKCSADPSTGNLSSSKFSKVSTTRISIIVKGCYHSIYSILVREGRKKYEVLLKSRIS